MINEKKFFWLWAGWVASRSLSAQGNGGGGGGSDATTDQWQQPFSAVRASEGCPGNDLRLAKPLLHAYLDTYVESNTTLWERYFQNIFAWMFLTKASPLMPKLVTRL